VPANTGTLVSINTSNGGVPKLPRAVANVRTSGIEGDRQRDLRYHGGPDRAVCLYSADLIDALRAEGHPIAPGTIGENFTIAGLDWGIVAPGLRIAVGPVLLEVTAPAQPCRNIAGSFQQGTFGRVSQKTYPGWARWYARVLEAGQVSVGQEVVVEPTSRAVEMSTGVE
jgi:MOSC domain-containing protein YiiM